MAPPLPGIKESAKGLSNATGDFISSIARRAGDGLSHADKVVKSHDGFRGTFKHFMKEKPVTTGLVTASVVAAPVVVGANMMAAHNRSQAQQQGYAR